MYSLVEINYLFVYLVIITDILDLHSLDVYTQWRGRIFFGINVVIHIKKMLNFRASILLKNIKLARFTSQSNSAIIFVV